jgi:hypothetical protein
MKTTFGFFWFAEGVCCANTTGAAIEIANIPISIRLINITGSIFFNLLISNYFFG